MIVEFTPEARQDFADALDYLGLHSPAAAARLRRRIEQAIDRLATGFIEGLLARLRRAPDTRVTIVPPYGIYYRRAENHLVIMRIYHQARKPLE